MRFFVSDLAAGYNHGQQFLYALTYRIHNLKKYEKVKNKVILNQQVQRLTTIRKETSYQMAVDSFLAAFGNQGYQ